MNYNMSAQSGSQPEAGQPRAGAKILGRKYFFILGTNPTLSVAELAAIFDHGKISLVQKDIAILECGQKIEADLINIIGGTIKIGSVRQEIDSYAVKDILNSIANFAKPEKAGTKFRFGFSYYGKRGINLKALAMEFKKLLKQSAINSRWVTSREPTLSSVVVEQNKLITDKGAEIVMIQFNHKLFLGKTLAVQPFKELSFRDYGRPARDSHSGMLPLKLSQIMINLSGASEDKIILDPFCGSGTIITEALLRGYQRIIGADISAKAIQDTKQNIEWLEKNYELEITNYQLHKIDSAQISRELRANSVDAIITEPYLGPQRGRFDINKTVNELERLYAASLLEFKKILKPGGRLVMVWPVFSGRQKNIFLNPDLAGLKIFNPLPPDLQKNVFMKLTNRKTIIYGREQQKVWREIVVLEKLKS